MRALSHAAKIRFLADGGPVPDGRCRDWPDALDLPGREELDGVLAEDPFHRERVATYHVIEFNPTKFGMGVEALLGQVEGSFRVLQGKQEEVR